VWDEEFRRIRESEVKAMWIVLNGEDAKYKVKSCLHLRPEGV